MHIMRHFRRAHLLLYELSHARVGHQRHEGRQPEGQLPSISCWHVHLAEVPPGSVQVSKGVAAEVHCSGHALWGRQMVSQGTGIRVMTRWQLLQQQRRWLAWWCSAF